MTENTNRPPEATPTEAPLESWKEIATYLKRGVRTVKRWEKHEALPVRRHLHHARSSVYAYASELEAWKAARQPGFDQAPLAMPWRRPIPALGFALTLLLALVSVASGPILTPLGALAQESGGMVARQVWAGPDAEIWHTALSSDGRYYTYVDWSTGDLALRDLTTGQNRHLTNKGSWLDSPEEFALSSTLSPDDQQVAYTWYNKDSQVELRLIGLDGSEPRVLYRNKETEYIDPWAWSPDGKHIVATLARIDRTIQIVVISVAEGSVRVLKTLDWGYPQKVSLSPDGRAIVYDFPPQQDFPQRDIFLLATDGSSEIPLVQHPANDVRPVWAPDGKRVVFASNRTGTMDAWTIEVTDGKPQRTPRLLKQDLGRSVAIRFTRDGSYYYGLQTGMKDVYIATLDLATGKVVDGPNRATQRFVGSNFQPDWSPDGQYLAYVSAREALVTAGGYGSMTIAIRSLKTGEERDLSSEIHAPRLRPRWSPDGRSFLVTGTDKKGRLGIYQIDVQTGHVTPLVQTQPGTNLRWATWSPDGKSIFYSRNLSRILVQELETGREKELYRAAAPSVAGHLALSPDGRQLAFITNDPATRSDLLMVMPAGGGEPRELLGVQAPEGLAGPFDTLVWTPDGREILSVRNRRTRPHEMTTEVWRIPVDGGEPQKLGLAMEGLRDLRVHPDGQRIAFTAGQGKAELWVLENFLPKPKAKAARLEE